MYQTIHVETHIHKKSSTASFSGHDDATASMSIYENNTAVNYSDLVMSPSSADEEIIAHSILDSSYNTNKYFTIDPLANSTKPGFLGLFDTVEPEMLVSFSSGENSGLNIHLWYDFHVVDHLYAEQCRHSVRRSSTYLHQRLRDS